MLDTSPQLNHFTNEEAISAYFSGLHDATNRRDYTRLTAFYLARLEDALDFTRSRRTSAVP